MKIFGALVSCVAEEVRDKSYSKPAYKHVLIAGERSQVTSYDGLCTFILHLSCDVNAYFRSTGPLSDLAIIEYVLLRSRCTAKR
jgi:hypothetical protein